MTKNEYLEALKQGLRSLPFQEQEDALQYYAEYFDDAGVENEAQVIAELGAPEELAQYIIQNSMFSLARAPQDGKQDGKEGDRGDGSAPKTFQQMGAPPKQPAQTDNKTLLWVLLILSSIIWVPLLIGVVATIGGLLIGVVAIAAGLGIAAVAMLLAFIFCLGMGIPLLLTSTADGALLIGLALMYLAGVLLLVSLCVLTFQNFLPWCWKQCKRLWAYCRQKMAKTKK